ncbi:MAG: histidine phosphatase family protein [Nocardiopsaceae bacterium]|nr:histidine phosphatase family protein [Nocardiopsaceae bacterium]
MTDTTVVHLLRHGEVHNPGGVLYGRLPGYHLSATGRAMADAAADFFSERMVATVFASPLTRAQETAEPVAARHGLEIVTDERLIESRNVLEGTAVSLRYLARNPANWRYLWNPFAPSWGEPYAEVAARMRAAVERARDASRGAEAVCVSHQLPIWVTRLAAERRRLWSNPRECALGSVTSLTFTGDELTGVSYAVPARRQVREEDAAQ